MRIARLEGHHLGGAAPDATVRLVVKRECQLIRRVCSACHRLDEVLALGLAEQS